MVAKYTSWKPRHMERTKRLKFKESRNKPQYKSSDDARDKILGCIISSDTYISPTRNSQFDLLSYHPLDSLSIQNTKT